MRQSDLLKTVSSYVAELEKIDRFIKLDDNHIAVIDVMLFKQRRGRRDDDEDIAPHARVSVFERDVDDGGKVTADEWSCVDFESCDSRLLGRVAELTAMCEKWSRDELDDLPVSTADDPRGKRRVYRRLQRG